MPEVSLLLFIFLNSFNAAYTQNEKLVHPSNVNEPKNNFLLPSMGQQT
jgi:hypothetical protein